MKFFLDFESEIAELEARIKKLESFCGIESLEIAVK